MKIYKFILVFILGLLLGAFIMVKVEMSVNQTINSENSTYDYSLVNELEIGEKVDMTGYSYMGPENNYLEIDFSDLKNNYNNKDFSGTILVSFTGCSHCQNIVYLLNNYMKFNNFNIYYFNAEALFDKENRKEFVDMFNSYLADDEEGEEGDKVIYTPMLISIKNGEVVKSQYGMKTEDDINAYFNELVSGE